MVDGSSGFVSGKDGNGETLAPTSNGEFARRIPSSDSFLRIVRSAPVALCPACPSSLPSPDEFVRDWAIPTPPVWLGPADLSAEPDPEAMALPAHLPDPTAAMFIPGP